MATNTSKQQFLKSKQERLSLQQRLTETQTNQQIVTDYASGKTFVLSETVQKAFTAYLKSKQTTGQTRMPRIRQSQSSSHSNTTVSNKGENSPRRQTVDDVVNQLPFHLLKQVAEDYSGRSMEIKRTMANGEAMKLPFQPNKALRSRLVVPHDSHNLQHLASQQISKSRMNNVNGQHTQNMRSITSIPALLAVPPKSEMPEIRCKASSHRYQIQMKQSLAQSRGTIRPLKKTPLLTEADSGDDGNTSTIGSNTGLPPAHMFNSAEIRRRIEKQISNQQRLFDKTTNKLIKHQLKRRNLQNVTSTGLPQPSISEHDVTLINPLQGSRNVKQGLSLARLKPITLNATNGTLQPQPLRSKNLSLNTKQINFGSSNDLLSQRYQGDTNQNSKLHPLNQSYEDGDNHFKKMKKSMPPLNRSINLTQRNNAPKVMMIQRQNLNSGNNNRKLKSHRHHDDEASFVLERELLIHSPNTSSSKTLRIQGGISQASIQRKQQISLPYQVGRSAMPRRLGSMTASSNGDSQSRSRHNYSPDQRQYTRASPDKTSLSPGRAGDGSGLKASGHKGRICIKDQSGGDDYSSGVTFEKLRLRLKMKKQDQKSLQIAKSHRQLKFNGGGQQDLSSDEEDQKPISSNNRSRRITKPSNQQLQSYDESEINHILHNQDMPSQISDLSRIGEGLEKIKK